jgi:hypothetical protein
MSNTVITEASQVANLLTLQMPAITLWNRAEGRPRALAFDRALRAEVRDALWMLTRQWQLGEFKGDDAASPISAKVQLGRTHLTKYRADGFTPETYDDMTPLETKVERRPVPLKQQTREMSLDIRVLAGRHWLKMIAATPAVRDAYIAKYPIHQPDPSNDADAVYCAHPEAWSSFAAFAGRAMDGVKLYEFITDPNATNHASDGIAGVDSGAIDTKGGVFIQWFRKLIDQPPAEDAWLPDRLEYQFAVAAPDASGEKVYIAEEYFQGHLDWYNLDLDPKLTILGNPDGQQPDPPKNRVMIPTPVSFAGMPNTRWWTFEDGRTSFGDINPQTTEPSKLLLMEFGLTFANDWFLVPYTTPAGSIVKVRGLAVTDVFGDRTWIEAAGSGPDDDWERWAMFLVNTKGKGGEAADTSLLLLPAAADVQEGRPFEEVMLVRDEIANMVWGVETTIPLPSGEGKSGSVAGRELRAHFERKADALPPPLSPPPYVAAIRYDAMRGVPEHWIPFLPVHVPGSSRKTQLQRGAMLRIIEKLSAAPKVRPRTSLLRAGLDAGQPYFLHEEEVPRAGVIVTQRYQRTRWRDGRARVWIGVRKQTGRGEASSTLAFDRVVPVPKP